MFSYLDQLNAVLWHPYVLYILLFTGIVFTLWSRFSQLTSLTHGVALLRGKYDHKEDPGAISHFQALSAALSATVGLGNIAGVALAISIGGPGAIFWLWVVGFFGMALKSTEVIQSMLYRNITNPSEPHGGPMWVCLKGFGELGFPRLGRLLGGIFCLTLLVSTFTGGNMFQAWNVADITFSYFSIPKWITGLVLTVLSALVIIGGIRRIGQVAGTLVPFMCLTYVGAGLTVLVYHIDQIPSLLLLILKSGLPEFFGGSAHEPVGPFLGAGVGLAFMKGMQRALFSNEAGQGSAPIAHSAAKTREPVSEGVVAGLEPFIDTLCVCTMTALVILSSGVWSRAVDLNWMTPPSSTLTESLPTQVDKPAEAVSLEQDVFVTYISAEHTQPRKWMGQVTQILPDRYEITWQPRPEVKNLQLTSQGVYLDHKGATLTAKAFDLVFSDLGKFIVPITVWLFALSTMISWSYYGEQGAVFLWGEKSIPWYRWVYCFSILLATSPLIETESELDIVSSLGTGVMLWVNIPLMLIFGHKAMSAYFDYKRRVLDRKARV